jgi:hypothetical protein
MRIIKSIYERAFKIAIKLATRNTLCAILYKFIFKPSSAKTTLLFSDLINDFLNNYWFLMTDT